MLIGLRDFSLENLLLVMWYFFGDSPVSWRNKKQSTISRSSTESEYRALRSLSFELIWGLKILYDIGFKIFVPVNIFCDNDSVIKLAMNPISHDKTKHF